MSGFTPSHSLHSILPVLQAVERVRCKGEQALTSHASYKKGVDKMRKAPQPLRSTLPVLQAAGQCGSEQ